MKVYAILMTMALILFGVFFLKKAFVGKNVSNLDKINAQIDAASKNSAINAPGVNTSTTIETPPAPAKPPADAQPAPTQTPVAAAPTPEPVQTAAPVPAKGGMGEAMKKIIDKRDAQKQQLEKSFNTPE